MRKISHNEFLGITNSKGCISGCVLIRFVIARIYCISKVRKYVRNSISSTIRKFSRGRHNCSAFCVIPERAGFGKEPICGVHCRRLQIPQFSRGVIPSCDIFSSGAGQIQMFKEKKKKKMSNSSYLLYLID
jgi:hypothetical protein